MRERDYTRLSSNLLRELWSALVALILIVCVAATGFHFIEDWSWFDSLYMVIITVSTVGYGEINELTPWGRGWAIVTIFLGIGVASYSMLTVGRLAAMGLVEGELKRGLARRRMKKVIETISDHHLVCGYGRIGREVARGLQAAGASAVVIEADREKVEELEDEGVPYIRGDATEDDVLLRAGIERAKGMAICTPSDPDNLFITLTARELNPAAYILTRCSDPSAQHRLLRAGADKVINPHKIGGQKIASSLLRPTVVEMWDLATGVENTDIAVEEAEILAGSELIGRPLARSELRERFGVIIVAIKRNGTMLFNPKPTEVFQEGDLLITIGHEKDLTAMGAALGPASD